MKNLEMRTMGLCKWTVVLNKNFRYTIKILSTQLMRFIINLF